MRESERTIAAVEAALVLLDAFEGAEPVRLLDLHVRTGLSNSRLLRLLGTLEACGYVVNAGRGMHALGPKAYRLGWALRDSLAPMLNIVRPALDRAVADTDATAFFSILRGKERVVIAKSEPSQGVRYVVEEGQIRPLHVGATGRVILAHLPLETIEAILSAGPLVALTHSTMTDPAELRAALDAIRTDGYALSLGEATTQAFAVAVPVLAGTRVIGAMSLAGPLSQCEARRERCLDTLKREGALLSKRMA